MSGLARTLALPELSCVVPCLIYEDEHLLVVNKPAGVNTHAPSPYSGEGIYDWLRHREPRWANLAIMQRLDKETSGVLVFSKTVLGNRSLTAQFAGHSVRKKYRLLTDQPGPRQEIVVKSALVRAGERYVSRPLHAGGETAETRFRECGVRSAECGMAGQCRVVEAEPLTGRTHQIRVHAAESGFPILGDTLYGGTPAARVYLHAAELTLKHPASGEEKTFQAPIAGPLGGWTGPLPCLGLREALIDPEASNAYRLIHGASDSRPGWYVDRLGEFLLSQGAEEPGAEQREELKRLAEPLGARGVYHKALKRQAGRAARAEASPRLLLGEAAPERFTVRENGVLFELGLGEGYSTGLFLDQRDNRRRLLTRHVSAEFPLLVTAAGDESWEVLNTFGYTCAFSVCAAKAGARTTSIDLSKHYLEWGKRNFALNGLEAEGHKFLHGDVLDWLRRLGKKRRQFDVVLLDPPTFSQSKASGVFRAEKDYGRLVRAALPLLKADGVLFASTNAAGWAPEEFLGSVEEAIRESGRRIVQRHYVPQPPDFPVSRDEPAYLKTVWLWVA